jgi:hypothetical protein
MMRSVNPLSVPQCDCNSEGSSSPGMAVCLLIALYPCQQRATALGRLLVLKWDPYTANKGQKFNSVLSCLMP